MRKSKGKTSGHVSLIYNDGFSAHFAGVMNQGGTFSQHNATIMDDFDGLGKKPHGHVGGGTKKSKRK